MQHQPVTSAAIRSIAHEGDVLEVTLTNGRTYRHTGVTAAVFDEMRAAESMGRFYNQRIKGAFPAERVEESERPESVESGQ